VRLEYPHRFERFGAVKIHGIQQVIELDSGAAEDDEQAQGRLVLHAPRNELSAIQDRMAIVVPCKDERRKVIEGVLSGIPHDCLIIIVSNSAREPVDRYQIECQMAERFCYASERSAVLVHQRDPGLAAALIEGGFSELVDDDGLVRNGKGEGMMVGMALAAMAGRTSVGFIDADNYVPGAVTEYVNAYAAAMFASTTPYSMVRISWQSKPKIEGGRLFFNRWGRTSQVTNQFLNLLLAQYSGFGTEIIATGNAGEHAMTLALGMRMRMAAGFAVEPNQYLDMFEQYGGVVESPHPEVMKETVDVFQVETRNPHFHENKGADHVQEMRLQALNVLYHSPICPQATKDEIVQFLIELEVIEPGQEPPKERVYPPLENLDLQTFGRALGEHGDSFTQVHRRKASGITVEAPILLDAPN
jgi:mannosyl-3-phosphoglycerate synthase